MKFVPEKDWFGVGDVIVTPGVAPTFADGKTCKPNVEINSNTNDIESTLRVEVITNNCSTRVMQNQDELRLK